MHLNEKNKCKKPLKVFNKGLLHYFKRNKVNVKLLTGEARIKINDNKLTNELF